MSNGIQSHLDIFTTLAAAAGRPNIATEFKAEKKVHIDGVNNLAHWQGQGPSQRRTYLYYNERVLSAIRVGPWKAHFQRRDDFFDYSKPTRLLFNLRMDPFEQHDGIANQKLALKKAWIGGVIQDELQMHMQSLREFPPRQGGGSLTPAERVK